MTNLSNAVFVVTWHEPGQENGVLIGAFRSFVRACDGALGYVTAIAEGWKAICEGDDTELLVMRDAHGVPFLTDSKGRDGGKVRIRELVVR